MSSVRMDDVIADAASAPAAQAGAAQADEGFSVARPTRPGR